MSRKQELLDRLAQIIMVAKCKCFMQRSKSTTHVDCLHVDTWIFEELVCAVQITEVPHSSNASVADSILYTESLDSLMPENSKTRWQ
ncbi:unnamed protein product [Caenorhabditis auriculariae]|uniref:Uncharacterized protein n=1 Tax=Caenorhabditis auriculariae TaxID=2777116 RepID=A0A8S1H1I2_9PELO|nr:unnamed protein product [Caenorhabditis auriculariae]